MAIVPIRNLGGGGGGNKINVAFTKSDLITVVSSDKKTITVNGSFVYGTNNGYPVNSLTNLVQYQSDSKTTITVNDIGTSGGYYSYRIYVNGTLAYSTSRQQGISFSYTAQKGSITIAVYNDALSSGTFAFNCGVSVSN